MIVTASGVLKVNLLRSLPFSWALGLSLFAGRGRSRVSIATVVSVLGIGVGVATLTAVLAVTGGFEETFRDRILGVYPHMVVMKRGEQFDDYREVGQTIAALSGVAGVNPSTYDEMMISSDSMSAGAIVKGVDLDGVDRVSRLRSLTRQGNLEGLRYKPDEPMRVLLGCELMRRLKTASGERVTLTTPIRGLGTFGPGPLGMAPVQQSFVVHDCFESGFYEYDSRLVVMDLASAQAFLNRGPTVRWIELRLLDFNATDSMRSEVLSALEPYGVVHIALDAAKLRRDVERLIASNDAPSSIRELVTTTGAVGRALGYARYGASATRYRVIDWKEMNKNLFSALRMQKVVLALFFLIIVMVAAFNIVGTQLIVARERVKEVSTLIALGAARRQLIRIFIVHGFTLGCAGVACGLLLGRLVVTIITHMDMSLDPKVYMITRLPAVLHWVDALTIALLSAAVVLASCILSSWRATRLNPVDGLRKVV